METNKDIDNKISLNIVLKRGAKIMWKIITNTSGKIPVFYLVNFVSGLCYNEYYSLASAEKVRDYLNNSIEA